MTLLETISLIILIAVAVYLWLKKSKTSQQTVPAEYTNLLQTHVKYFRNLKPEQKEQFAKRVQAFLKQVHIEGVGTEITLVDKILVAASAIIPIFGFGDWRYPNITNVILYPDTFNEEFQFEGSGRSTTGMVGTGYMNGQMILSKSALHAGFSHDESKSNTPIHEFVHLLDKTDGATDGIPEQLMEQRSLEPWLNLMHREIERINNGESDINPYALTGDAEFFAVVSEYFFQQPHLMATNHPEIYQMLTQFFRQDWVKGT
ncbi:MAG TPA: M90 family metallopeptidase [Daejeonella sp.]|nr:M90 family metallopeptidase [Daejeonella sp.]